MGKGKEGFKRSFPHHSSILSRGAAVAGGIGTRATRAVARRIGVVAGTIAGGIGAPIPTHHGIGEVVGKDFEAFSIV